MATVAPPTSTSSPTIDPSPDPNLPSSPEAANSESALLLYAGFNQDSGCFAVGTEQGFQIYNCDPFRETFRRDFNNGGGIGIVEMLFRCNILALVGGGSNPQFPPNKVMIWDDHQSQCIGELSFRSEVRAVKLRRDRIVVVLEHKIYVYNFGDLKLLHQIETIANPKGLCAISHASNSFVLACPGLHKGQMRVEHYGLKKTKFISAHDSRISCFALTLDGGLLATASTKGTLVRIFNTLDGTRLQEVRRGADRAEIYSLAFSSNAQWLAVSSDKGTVHIFGLNVPRMAEDPRIGEGMQGVSGTNGSGVNLVVPSLGANPGSSLSFMKGVLPKYFSSQWSFAQFHLPEGLQFLVAFGHKKNTIIIVGLDGSFYRLAFDPVHGGEMVQQEYAKFLKSDESNVL
ncbi:hypothetical protein SUGI_0970640 [Cryptomeria japonica]|uniref:autophagy-related protein 18a n=1 Tax=Cryptomeria japonica TaxID=3369 RepID=UPI00241474F2|nr:autophagy-related protein 18a [Cryptomeria japonica]GLJ46075.1 hypothetical protein SUGI_0970640 [Cryptomeria japonica]